MTLMVADAVTAPPVLSASQVYTPASDSFTDVIFSVPSSSTKWSVLENIRFWWGKTITKYDKRLYDKHSFITFVILFCKTI